MNKFRHISLLNCSFKIFSKVLTNRLAVIFGCQSAFIKGRYILESVVTAHEIIHEFHSSRKHGMVLKLDYEKAYDIVDWRFMWGLA